MGLYRLLLKFVVEAWPEPLLHPPDELTIETKSFPSSGRKILAKCGFVAVLVGTYMKFEREVIVIAKVQEEYNEAELLGERRGCVSCTVNSTRQT